MGSGDSPGLQNRRAASLMSPVCSTHTRFRHDFPLSFKFAPDSSRLPQTGESSLEESPQDWWQHRPAVNVLLIASASMPRYLLISAGVRHLSHCNVTLGHNR